jgi:hypothetical protein
LEIGEGWSDIQFFPTAANSSGVLIGDAIGNPEVHTQFIFHSGVFHCCITDSPFRLNGISNTGWIGGNARFYGDPEGDGLVGIGPYARRDAGTPWVAGFPDLAELLPADMLYYSEASEIIAIDNRNQLLLANGYAIVLIPEPSGLWIVSACQRV